jgi:hypothetical protein
MMMSMTMDRVKNMHYFKKQYKENKKLRNKITQQPIVPQ